MISLNVNNIAITLPVGSTVYQACLKIGITLPSFCFHEQLNIAGNCRMCLVEIEKQPKPIVACAFPITEGLQVFTNTPLVKKARENILEFLLINHPLDCPICDQGGECDLQDQAFFFGRKSSRFSFFKRVVENKNYSPFIKTIMTRCIHCTRCIRFASEILNLPFYGTIHRGNFTEISSYFLQLFRSEMSGNVIDLCPVGALTSKPYAFRARPWELDSFECFDIFDSYGAQIRVDYKHLNIMRILPGVHKQHNTEWISDRIRFSVDAYKFNRLFLFFIKSKKQILSSKTFQDLEKILLINERQFEIYNQLHKKRYFFTTSYIIFFGSTISQYFIYNFKKMNFFSFLTKNLSFNHQNIDFRNFFLPQNILQLKNQSIIFLNMNYKVEIPNLYLDWTRLEKFSKLKYYFFGLNATFSTKNTQILFKKYSFINNFENLFFKNTNLFLYHIAPFIRIDISNFYLFFVYLNMIFLKNQKLAFTFSRTTQLLLSECNLNFNYNWFFFTNNLYEKSVKLLNFNETDIIFPKKLQKGQFSVFFGHHTLSRNFFENLIFPIKTFLEQNDLFLNIFGMYKTYQSKFTDNSSQNIQTLENYFTFFFKKSVEHLRTLNSKKLLFFQQRILTTFFQKKYKCNLTSQPFVYTNSFNTNIITQNSLNLNKAIKLFLIKSNFT